MKRFVIVAVLAALAAPVVAGAAVPSAVEAPDLEQRVHSPTPVYCGVGTDWTRAAFGTDAEVFGYSLIPQRISVLAPDVCATLRGPLEVNIEWADAAEALLHEVSHVWWQNRDEAATECFALFIFRWEVRHGFGATAGQAQLLYNDAWRAHLARSSAYQGCAVYMAADPLAAY
jgi:hypothetical protein